MSAKDGQEVYLYTHNKIQLLSLYRLKLGAHDMSNAPLALELNMSGALQMTMIPIATTSSYNLLGIRCIHQTQHLIHDRAKMCFTCSLSYIFGAICLVQHLTCPMSVRSTASLQAL